MPVENVIYHLTSVQGAINDAIGPSITTVSKNEEIHAKMAGTAIAAKDTIGAATRAHENAEEALSTIRMIESQTDHPEPRQIAFHLNAALAKIETVFSNAKQVKEKIEELERLVIESGTESPIPELSRALGVLQTYRNRL